MRVLFWLVYNDGALITARNAALLHTSLKSPVHFPSTVTVQPSTHKDDIPVPMLQEIFRTQITASKKVKPHPVTFHVLFLFHHDHGLALLRHLAQQTGILVNADHQQSFDPLLHQEIDIAPLCLRLTVRVT